MSRTVAHTSPFGAALTWLTQAPARWWLQLVPSYESTPAQRPSSVAAMLLPRLRSSSRGHGPPGDRAARQGTRSGSNPVPRPEQRGHALVIPEHLPAPSVRPATWVPRPCRPGHWWTGPGRPTGAVSAERGAGPRSPYAPTSAVMHGRPASGRRSAARPIGHHRPDLRSGRPQQRRAIGATTRLPVDDGPALLSSTHGPRRGERPRSSLGGNVFHRRLPSDGLLDHRPSRPRSRCRWGHAVEPDCATPRRAEARRRLPRRSLPART